MQFESYYDEYMMQWTVRNTETLVMYPCTSENMTKEFCKILNDCLKENERLKHRVEFFKALAEGVY